ncbi:MAG TPA: prepilin-type N-terminal cleavage/methylation domain-containing protein [Gemmatimonadales bacterium]|nr:prepilin-type N-terminal cleavage/methylation domain-containing protein [Gemmatimonadales bacterium]
MLTTQTARPRSAGFTLVELLVVMVLMGLVTTAMVKLLLRQTRFYNSTNELIQTRQQIRQAAFMLPSDLRAISRAGGDIYSMTDSSIDFRSMFGSSVACVINVGKLWINTVPQKLAKGSAMTNWKVAPSVNDSVAVYDDAASTGVRDDIWTFHRIALVTQVAGDNANGCSSTSGLAQAADLVAGNPSYQLTVSPAPSKTANVGAAIRFFRHVHYSLYRWATDGKWYLGYYDCLPNRVPSCATIQPIAGPLQPYAASVTGTSGLQFTYYDSTGVVTANPALVARFSVVVRGQGQTLINLTGGTAVPLRDSVRIEVSVRNRN